MRRVTRHRVGPEDRGYEGVVAQGPWPEGGVTLAPLPVGLPGATGLHAWSSRRPRACRVLCGGKGVRATDRGTWKGRAWEA